MSTGNSVLPQPFGEPVLQARFRVELEDFRVDEMLAFEPSGEGEHLLLHVEKRGANTVWVAQQLARWASIPERAVGYAGLKDRHAVTRQYFSLHLPKRVAPAVLPVHPEFAVVGQRWHARKLPRGALEANRFAIVLRDVEGDQKQIEARLQQIGARGVPNYFGEQRFGRDGDNVDGARKLFAGARMDRAKRSILLSAARSALFNQVLAARIAADVWDVGIDGEVWMLDGSHSVFGPEALTEMIVQRAAEMDIHPTGPMWGAGALRSSGRAALIELEATEADEDLKAGLCAAGLRQERRALRLPVRALSWRWPQENLLELGFALPSGSYATSVLAALGTVRQ